MKNKIGWLNNLRGLAALMVLLSHWTKMFEGAALPSMATLYIKPQFIISSEETYLNSIYDFLTAYVVPWLPLNFSLGAGGVLFFFLISGFVILVSLEKYRSTEFMIARYFRLVPTLVFTLLAILLLRLFLTYVGYIDEIGFGIVDFIINASLVTDVAWTPSIELAIWTLLIEVKFYILMAFVFYFNDRKVNAKTFLSLSVGLFALASMFIANDESNLFGFLYKQSISLDAFNIFIAAKIISETTPFLMYMFCGAASYFYYYGQIRFPVYLIYLTIFFTFYAFLRLATQYAFEEDQFVYVGDGLSVLIVFASLVTFFKNKKDRNLKKSIVNSFLQFFAKVSYPLYLLQAAFGMTVVYFFQHLLGNANIAILLASFCVIGLSYLCHRLVEIPSARFGKKIGNLCQSHISKKQN